MKQSARNGAAEGEPVRILGRGPRAKRGVHLTLRAGGVVLELYPAGGRNTSDVRLGFVVRDLTRTLEQVRHLGGTVLSESAGHAVVVDPDGHKIELTGEPT